MTPEAFVEHCQTIVADCATGELSTVDAAAAINQDPVSYPFEGRAHPMLCEIADLAFEISEEIGTAEESASMWQDLTKTLEAYVAGKWASTCWMMSASYNQYDGETLIQSFSVVVRRRNGTAKLDAAVPELHAALAGVVDSLNQEQTDEHFVRNAAFVLPAAISSYRLSEASVQEYLTKAHI